MKMTISKKIVFISALGVMAASAVVLFISMIMMGNQYSRIINDEMIAMQSMVVRLQEQDEERVHRYAYLLANMPQLIDAIGQRDSVGIKNIMVTSLHQLGLDSIAVTNATGIVLARGLFELAGDDISARPEMDAALRGEVVHGIVFQEAAMVPYCIRTYMPIYNGGTQVGVLILGLDIGTEAYVDGLRNITRMEFTLYKNNIRTMTTLKDVEGNRAIGTRLEDAEILDRVLNHGEMILKRLDIFGAPYKAVYWPIIDFRGEIVGMWAMSEPLAEQIAMENSFMMIMISCSIGVALLFTLLAGVLGSRIAKPVRKVTNYAVQVADGNLELPLTVKSNDEVGLLANALQTMVATLKERIHQNELQRAFAEEASKAKSAFLSTMSHEIRTPMSVVLGMTEVQLQRNDLDVSAKEAFKMIYSSGDVLLSIINNILDLSKIEAGKLEIQNERYEIASLISDAAQLNMTKIYNKPIGFELVADDKLPATLFGDELRIKQILSNLLSNAFKYTSVGSVRLTFFAKTNETAHDEITLVMSVSDTGQGMTAEQVKGLFDEYNRFNLEANRSTEGTGLGMSITKSLLLLMNGEIRVESEPGKGSKFTVCIPQIRVGAETLGKENAENLSKFRARSGATLKRANIKQEPMPYGSVLIVDDMKTNIYVAKELMAPYKLHIEAVLSGFEAIDIIKSGKVYDIIFMDHMMPEMDGIETTKILRSLGYENPIVALTANAVVGQSDIFFENGFDEFISKPINIRRLNEVLNQFVNDKRSASATVETQGHARDNLQAVDAPFKEDINPSIASVFVADAQMHLGILENFVKNGCLHADLEMFVVSAHGLRSVLTYVGNTELSAFASKLEKLGRDGDVEVLEHETPVFNETLREYIEKLTSEVYNEGVETVGWDKANVEFLYSKLLVVKAACGVLDKSVAEHVIVELRKTSWPKTVKELLGGISANLLHGEFDEAIDAVNEFLMQARA